MDILNYINDGITLEEIVRALFLLVMAGTFLGGLFASYKGVTE